MDGIKAGGHLRKKKKILHYCIGLNSPRHILPPSPKEDFLSLVLYSSDQQPIPDNHKNSVGRRLRRAVRTATSSPCWILIRTVWIVGCINTLLSEYMVSKNPHTLCSIRDDLSSNLVIRDDINQSGHKGLPFCCYFS